MLIGTTVWLVSLNHIWYTGMTLQDSVNHPTKIQSARAANFIQALFYYRKLILKERLEPVSREI